MYPAEFSYHRAQSLSDAHRLLASHPGAKLLAGGHSLIPLLKLRLSAPPAVIDIGRIPELRGIAPSGEGFRIGALTTHAEIARSAELRKAAAALAEAAAMVGDPAVRNRGTIGGNVAHADPASDLPTVLVALAATIIASGPKGERTIPAEQFFTGIMTTALANDEIIAAVVVPKCGRREGSAYVKFSHPASRYAVIGAAARLSVKDGACSAARVALGGLLPCARRAVSVERSLVGQPATAGSFASAAGQIRSDLGTDVSGDIFASAEYRTAMAPVYVKRAIAAAAARAGLQ
jgi:carbon-monoxide dehydrogenase medium subunit